MIARKSFVDKMGIKLKKKHKKKTATMTPISASAAVTTEKGIHGN